MKQAKIMKTPEVDPVFSFLGATGKYVTFNITKGNFKKAASNPIYMASILSIMRKLKLEDIYMPNIEHGVNVVLGEGDHAFNTFSFDDINVNTTTEKSDAIISEEGKFLAIASADCMVATVVDIKTDIIGIAHVGWRGAVGDILLKTIDEIIAKGNSNKENIKICIGPSLKKENFEIMSDVKDILSDYCSKHKFELEKYIEVKDNDHWLFDQELLVKDALLDYGILKENLYISDMDTFSEPDISQKDNYLYHSYRRDGEDAGRILVGIVPRRYYGNVLKSLR